MIKLDPKMLCTCMFWYYYKTCSQLTAGKKSDSFWRGIFAFRWIKKKLIKGIIGKGMKNVI